MNLREELLKEHSKKQTLFITAWIGNSEKRFRQLIDLFLLDDRILSQRSSWVISHTAEKHPVLAGKFIPDLVKKLKSKNNHPAVKRNVTKLLQTLPIPEKLHAQVYNYCFEYINNPGETVAVKCYSMTVLKELAYKYPELKNETALAINASIKNSTAGIRARAKRVLRELQAVKHKNAEC